MTILIGFGVYEEVYLIKTYDEMYESVHWCLDNVPDGTWGTIGDRNIETSVLNEFRRKYGFSGSVFRPANSSEWRATFASEIHQNAREELRRISSKKASFTGHDLMALAAFIFQDPEYALQFKLVNAGA